MRSFNSILLAFILSVTAITDAGLGTEEPWGITKARQDALEDVLRDYPISVLKARMVGRPKYDDKKAKLSLDVEISLDMEKQMKFLDNLDKALTNIHGRGTTVNIDARNWKTHLTLGQFRGNGNTIGICKAMPVFPNVSRQIEKANMTWKLFTVDEATMEIARSACRPFVLRIDLTDKKDAFVLSTKVHSPAANGCGRMHLSFFPVLHMHRHGGYSLSDGLRPGADKHQFTVTLDASVDDLGDIENVLMQFEAQEK